MKMYNHPKKGWTNFKAKGGIAGPFVWIKHPSPALLTTYLPTNKSIVFKIFTNLFIINSIHTFICEVEFHTLKFLI